MQPYGTDLACLPTIKSNITLVMHYSLIVTRNNKAKK